MSNIVIRGVPDEVIAAIDANARKAGISRSEYVRRLLARERANSHPPVTVEDLAAFAETFSDLSLTSVVSDAWGTDLLNE